jgi:predicted AAA+ superfamily ATPase
MDTLFEKSYRRTDGVSLDFVRSMMDDIRWNNRLTCIRGARGVGKTTLLLQYVSALGTWYVSVSEFEIYMLQYNTFTSRQLQF